MAEQQASNEDILSRRQAIIAVATLPLALLLGFWQGQRHVVVMEEFLSRCVASIAACQHLMKTNGLEIVEQVLPKYLPTLITLTKQSSKYQQMAAHLTTQAYLLAALVALHRHRLSGCEECYKLAMRYSQLARDPNLKIATLKQFATRLVEDHRSNEALQLFRQALQIIDDNRDEISPLLGGLIYLGAARANAQLQEKKESEEHLSLGQQAFTEHVENVQNHVLPYVDCGIHHLFLSEGLIRVDLKDPQGAMNTFIRVENLPSTIIIPERVYLEIVNYQTSTSVILRDLDGFCIYLEKGINGAKRLGSEKRRQEAIGAYRQGRSVWPNESRVRDLADLLLN